MGGRGTVGWKGTGNRALEFPDGSTVDGSPSGRARLRYNRSNNELELSKNEAPYQALSSGGGSGPVANIAALSAVDDTALSDSAVVPMTSVLDLWMLDKSDTSTVNGISIIATNSGTGRWRRMNIPSPIWLQATTWHINASIGNDENVGSTAGTALATHAELQRRIGDQLIDHFITVNINADMTENLVVDWNFLRPTRELTASFGAITYQGTRTVLGSGTITAVTDWNHVAGSRAIGSIEASGLADTWTALGYVDQMIVATDGEGVGSIAWVARDLAGANNEARLNTWLDSSLSEVNIPNGTAFNVVSLTSITGHVIVGGNMASVLFQDLHINLATADTVAFSASNADDGFWQLNFCKITCEEIWCTTSATGTFGGCLLLGDTLQVRRGGNVDVVGSLFKIKVNLEEGSLFGGSSDTCFFQNPGAAGAGGSNLTGMTFSVLKGSFADIGLNLVFADFVLAADDSEVLIRTGSMMRLFNTLWGLNNSGSNYAIIVDPGSMILYSNTADARPDIQAGGSNDTLIGGVANAYGGLPAITAANVAGIVLG